MKKLTLEFQLGVHIGNYIICRFLPTLNTDMLKTRNVIDVTPEEFNKHKELDDKWFSKTYKKEVDSTEEWEELKTYEHQLTKKYIPEKLECYVDFFKVDNIDEFKKGISNSLWDCDLSHYSCNVNDIIIEELPKEYEDMVIRRKITLRRVIDE